MAPNHTAQLSFCLKWATFLEKLKLVQNTVRNRAVARNWPQIRLRKCRFAPNWAVLLRSYSLWETACATVLLIQIGAFCYKAKCCAKHRAQLSCCSKFASKHSAQQSFCLKWATFYIKLKLVQNAICNRAVARNWLQVRLRNGRFPWNWPVLLGR